jgi:hypothetical protein
VEREMKELKIFDNKEVEELLKERVEANVNRY